MALFWSQWLFLKIYSGQGFKVKIDCFLKVEVHFFMILERLFNDLGTFLKMWVIFSYHGETSMINTNFDWGRFLVDIHILSKIKITVTLIYFFELFLIFSTIPLKPLTKKSKSSPRQQDQDHTLFIKNQPQGGNLFNQNKKSTPGNQSTHPL